MDNRKKVFSEFRTKFVKIKLLHQYCHSQDELNSQSITYLRKKQQVEKFKRDIKAQLKLGSSKRNNKVQFKPGKAKRRINLNLKQKRPNEI